MLLRHITGAPKVNSLLAFSDYRRTENCRVTSWDGSLVEYETLELRLNPPQIEIENNMYDDVTVLTIDSANRSGTLVEVVMCLAELGLSITRARISSDGGWFVDEFYVTETPRGKVTDPLKISSMKKQTASPLAPCLRLLAQTMMVSSSLSSSYLRPMDAWALLGRVVLVFGARDAAGGAIEDDDKVQRLQQTLFNILGHVDTVVKYEVVQGAVHGERRMHYLILQEEKRNWDQQELIRKRMRTPPASSCSSADDPTAASALTKLGDVQGSKLEQWCMEQGALNSGLAMPAIGPSDAGQGALDGAPAGMTADSQGIGLAKVLSASADFLDQAVSQVDLGNLGRSNSTPPSNGQGQSGAERAADYQQLGLGQSGAERAADYQQLGLGQSGAERAADYQQLGLVSIVGGAWGVLRNRPMGRDRVVLRERPTISNWACDKPGQPHMLLAIVYISDLNLVTPHAGAIVYTSVT
eukprot:gene22476-29598_t